MVAACDDFDGLVSSKRNISNLIVPLIDIIRYAHNFLVLGDKTDIFTRIGPCLQWKEYDTAPAAIPRHVCVHPSPQYIFLDPLS